MATAIRNYEVEGEYEDGSYQCSECGADTTYRAWECMRCGASFIAPLAPLAPLAPQEAPNATP